MPPPFISLTEDQIFTAVRAFLLSATLSNIEVVQGQANRVPEPEGSDFIVITPLSQKRLGTNYTLTYDDVITGSISGTTLTVASFGHKAGPLLPGTVLLDNPAVLLTGTVLGSQITGTSGDIGTYNVSPSQTVSSETMYAGLRADLLSTELTIQADFHGPNSLNNSLAIDALFRSEVGVNNFIAGLFDIAPLYCGDARQMAFINDAQQYEQRWTMDLVLQVNPVINTPQQFAAALKVGLIEVDTTYSL